MKAQRMNIVFLFSDEHGASVMGNSGHSVVQTPNLDRLAEKSYTFENAYCNSPLCTPSRLSMLTGRYPHQINAWDLGVIADQHRHKTWGHYLGRSGYRTVLCGRTHFNGSDRLMGFSDRLLDDLPKWNKSSGRPPTRRPNERRSSNSHVTECGSGLHIHTNYDRQVTELALDFLNQESTNASKQPFLLYCGYMRPHFPLIAPAEFLSGYDPNKLELPSTWNRPLNYQHPVIQHLRWAWRNESPPPESIVRLALASYYALVSALDSQIGRIVNAIDSSPLADNTVIIYTSDHGEMAGHQGIWQKQCFYQPSVQVPLMLRLPANYSETGRVSQNVSLLDILPTLLDLAEESADLPGCSLLNIARNEDNRIDRPVFAEYHHMGMLNAGFMLKKGFHKLCYYVGHSPQLFDLRTDPTESYNLASRSNLVSKMVAELRLICNPEEVDRQAKADQVRRQSVLG